VERSHACRDVALRSAGATRGLAGVSAAARLRVLSVLVRPGVEKYPTAEADLTAFYPRQLPEVDRDVIVVDNALAPGVVERRARRTLIGGDNTAHEFSAFDRAVAHVGGEIWS